jgi:hypothetical protein
MIICPTQGFVFVHIPKCAGSAVGSQIKLCDPDHVAFSKVVSHPELGTIDNVHVPLGPLRAHFPDRYAAVRDMVAFCMLRDPLERFGSSLRQMLWRFEKRPMTAIPPDELRDTALRTLEKVDAELDRPEERMPTHQLVHFTRQVDYVYDRGERLVDHALPLELVPDLISYFSRLSGVPLDGGVRANQNVDLKVKALTGPAFAVNAALRRGLPQGAHARIKGAALRMLSSGRSAAESSGLLDLPEIREFVASHYARDAELYAAARADAPRLKRALADGALSPPVPGASATGQARHEEAGLRPS